MALNLWQRYQMRLISFWNTGLNFKSRNVVWVNLTTRPFTFLILLVPSATKKNSHSDSHPFNIYTKSWYGGRCNCIKLNFARVNQPTKCANWVENLTTLFRMGIIFCHIGTNWSMYSFNSCCEDTNPYAYPSHYSLCDIHYFAAYGGLFSLCPLWFFHTLLIRCVMCTKCMIFTISFLMLTISSLILTIMQMSLCFPEYVMSLCCWVTQR